MCKREREREKCAYEHPEKTDNDYILACIYCEHFIPWFTDYRLPA